MLSSSFHLPPGSLGLHTCRAAVAAAEVLVFPNQNLLPSDKHLTGIRHFLASVYFCTAKILSAGFFPAYLAGFYTEYCQYFCFLVMFHSDTIGHNIDLWKSEMLLEVSNGL